MQTSTTFFALLPGLYLAYAFSVYGYLPYMALYVDEDIPSNSSATLVASLGPSLDELRREQCLN